MDTRFPRCFAVLLMLFFPACGSDNPNEPTVVGTSTASGPGPTGTTTNPPSTGTMTAVINGIPYSADVSSVTNVNGILTVQSSSEPLGMGLGFIATSRAGTETVSATTPLAFNVSTISAGSPTARWEARGALGSGTLTIATLSSSTARGIFSFTAEPAPTGGLAATGSRLVTNGTFTVNF